MKKSCLIALVLFLTHCISAQNKGAGGTLSSGETPSHVSNKSQKSFLVVTLFDNQGQLSSDYKGENQQMMEKERSNASGKEAESFSSSMQKDGFSQALITMQQQGWEFVTFSCLTIGASKEGVSRCEYVFRREK